MFEVEGWTLPILQEGPRMAEEETVHGGEENWSPGIALPMPNAFPACPAWSALSARRIPLAAVPRAERLGCGSRRKTSGLLWPRQQRPLDDFIAVRLFVPVCLGRAHFSDGLRWRKAGDAVRE